MAKLQKLKLHVDDENVYLEINDFYNLVDTIQEARNDIKRLQKQIREHEIYKDAYYKILEIVDDTYLKTVEAEVKDLKGLL